MSLLQRNGTRVQSLCMCVCAADDKDFAVRIEVEEEEGMHTEAGIMEFLKDNTWMGLGPSKDEL